ncbi:MAG: hypothetical protein ACI8X5_003171 [Planctomycetota bacterium]|jgi:hypothetical protein
MARHGFNASPSRVPANTSFNPSSSGDVQSGGRVAILHPGKVRQSTVLRLMSASTPVPCRPIPRDDPSKPTAVERGQGSAFTEPSSLSPPDLGVANSILENLAPTAQNS